MAKVKYIKILKCDDLEIGKSAIIEVGDKEIALFNYKGDYYAIDNICPHRGAPLGEGRIEEGILICPNHEWRFELKSGWCPQNPELSTEVYPIKVHEWKNLCQVGKAEGRGSCGKLKLKSLPADLKVQSSYHCDNPVIQTRNLNWIQKNYEQLLFSSFWS